MNRMLIYLGLQVLLSQASFSAPAIDTSPKTLPEVTSDLPSSLVGIEYFSPGLDQPIPGSHCVDQGGGDVEIGGTRIEEWTLVVAQCGTRPVFSLARNLGYQGRHMKMRIVDSVALKPMPKGARVMEQGDCELDGQAGTTMFAVVRLGKRDRVDYRNGVLAAWTVDPQAGKIVALDTKRVVCYRPTPP